MIGIIGANSFIGRNLAQALAQTDAKLFAQDFDGFDFDCDKHSCVRMDFSEPDGFARKLEQCASLVLLMNSQRLDIGSYEDFLNVVSDLGHIKHVIFASSGGAIYGDGHTAPIMENALAQPKSAYGKTKFQIETLILECAQVANWDATIMRIGNPIGHHTKKPNFVSAALQAAREDEVLKLWAGKDYVRDYFAVQDLCRAIDAVIQSPPSSNRIYNIGSGVGHSIDQMLEIISKVSNKEIEIDQQALIKDDVRYNVLDCSVIKNDLGWSCEIEIEDVIKEMWERA